MLFQYAKHLYATWERDYRNHTVHAVNLQPAPNDYSIL